MTSADMLADGRSAYDRQAWAEAYDTFSAADRDKPLEPEDLERYAAAAHLLGKDVDAERSTSEAITSWWRVVIDGGPPE